MKTLCLLAVIIGLAARAAATDTCAVATAPALCQNDPATTKKYCPDHADAGTNAGSCVAACSSDCGAYVDDGASTHVGKCVVSATDCFEPTDITGYVVTNTNLLVGSFDVTVTCADNFEQTVSGTVPAATVCSSAGTAYTVTGCTACAATLSISTAGTDPTCAVATDCVPPTTLPAGYAGSHTGSLTISGWDDAGITCALDYEGTAVVAVCTGADPVLTDASYTGCTACSAGQTAAAANAGTCATTATCTAPTDTTGYVVTPTDATIAAFDVTATCAAGYGGTPVVTPCSATSATSAYALSGCTACAADKYNAAGGSSATWAGDSGSRATTSGTAVASVCLPQCSAGAFGFEECVCPGTEAGSCWSTKAARNPSSPPHALATGSTICAAATSCPDYTINDLSVAAAGSAPACGTSTDYSTTPCVNSAAVACTVPASTTGYVYVGAGASIYTSDNTYASASGTGTLTILGFDPDAGTPAAVTCADGYAGTAAISICSKPGDAFTFSGCTACASGKWAAAGNGNSCAAVTTCVAPVDTTGYTGTPGTLTITGFSADGLECADGYSGNADASVCTAGAGRLAYTGCTICADVATSTLATPTRTCDVVTLCMKPAAWADAETMPTGYVTTSLDVTTLISAWGTGAHGVTCAAGYEGTAVVAACTVGTPMLTAAKLSGCTACSAGQTSAADGSCAAITTCVAPADATGYVVTSTDATIAAFDVTATCADGYTGTAAVAACTATGTPTGAPAYTLTGCAACAAGKWAAAGNAGTCAAVCPSSTANGRTATDVFAATATDTVPNVCQEAASWVDTIAAACTACADLSACNVATGCKWAAAVAADAAASCADNTFTAAATQAAATCAPTTSADYCTETQLDKCTDGAVCTMLGGVWTPPTDATGTRCGTDATTACALPEGFTDTDCDTVLTTATGSTATAGSCADPPVPAPTPSTDPTDTLPDDDGGAASASVGAAAVLLAAVAARFQ